MTTRKIGIFTLLFLGCVVSFSSQNCKQRSRRSSIFSQDANMDERGWASLIESLKARALETFSVASKLDLGMDDTFKRLWQIMELKNLNNRPFDDGSGSLGVSKKVAWLAAVTYARLTKTLGYEPPKKPADILNFASDDLPLFECYDYAECETMLKFLSEFVDIDPGSLLRKIDEIRPLLQAVKGKTSQRILEYRVGSLETLARFYLWARFYDDAELGKTPLIKEEFKTQLVNRLNDLENIYRGEFSANKEEFLTSLKDELIDQETFDKQPEEAQKACLQIMQGIAESLNRTREGNISLYLYLDRVNRTDISDWLNGMLNRNKNLVNLFDVQMKKIAPDLAMHTLARFAKWELFLPYRTDWLLAMKQIKDDYPNPEFLQLYQTNANIHGDRINYLNNAIKSMELLPQKDEWRFIDIATDVAQGGPNKKEFRLIVYEKDMANLFPDFHSLYYQSMKFFKAQHELAVDSNKRAFSQSPEDRDALARKFDPYFEQWLKLSCFAAATHERELTYEELVVKMNWGSANEKGVHLSEVCKSWGLYVQTKTIDASLLQFDIYANMLEYQKPLRQFVENRRWWETYGPEIAKFTLEMAGIPFMLISGSVSHLVTKPLAIMATRYIARQMIIKGITTMTEAAAQQQIMQSLTFSAVSSFVNCLVFTAANQALTISFSNALGEIMPAGGPPGRSFYDSSKSLWDNYAETLSMGTAIFFFLPQVGRISHSVAAGLLKLEGSEAFSKAGSTLHGVITKQLPYVGITAGTDGAVFFSLPYIEEGIKNLLTGQQKEYANTDVLLKELHPQQSIGENLANSFLTALVFRVHGGLGANFGPNIREPLDPHAENLMASKYFEGLEKARWEAKSGANNADEVPSLPGTGEE